MEAGDENRIIEMAKSGCRDSMERIYRQYLPFLRSAAAKTERICRSVDFDDALQQGSVYFMDAVRTYETGHGTGFKFWAVMCVSQKLRRFWRSQVVIRIPENPKGEDAKKLSEAAAVVRFSELSKREVGGEFRKVDPVDTSVVSPLESAVVREEKRFLEAALSRLDPIDEVLVRGRLAGKIYEECGEEARLRLGAKISTHREPVRQRVNRALSRLENAIYESMDEARRQIRASLPATSAVAPVGH